MFKFKSLLVLAAIGAMVGTTVPAQAQSLDDWLKKLPLPFPLPDSSASKGDVSSRISQDRAALGLREALSIGATNAILKTGKRDGFYRNELIKILLPQKLRRMESTLRAFGAGRQIDEFVLGMNRAAEEATPHAKSIFADTIKGMSFSDVWGILRGGDTAATDYFRERMTPRLTTAFTPIVSRSMNNVGATRQYISLQNRYGNIPFVNQVTVDIDAYVVDEALDGLFKMVGEQERDIRRNPAARVTQVLKDVFGSIGR
jgi:hypothetical protein